MAKYCNKTTNIDIKTYIDYIENNNDITHNFQFEVKQLMHIENVEIGYVLRDEAVNVYMMTEGIDRFPENPQVFLCKRSEVTFKQQERWYLLDQKVTHPTYELSQFGEAITNENINVSLKYAMQIESQLKISVDRKIFEVLNPLYFPVWTPNAPVAYFDDRVDGYLWLCRVYEISAVIDEQLLEKGRKGRNSTFRLFMSNGKPTTVLSEIIGPVLSDSDYRIIKQDIFARIKYL
ncbi:MAG: hypothetical protein BWY46_01262 [Firmicutes bacterium ADurb.Bin300]|nr:MAG: hypothetical protein BWY46_01262 [Firmicutes bacterium ADurb.Bin300]